MQNNEKRIDHLFTVVPCYNEEEILAESARQLFARANELISNSGVESITIVFVDDGSKDKTWDKIDRIVSENTSPRVLFAGVKLAHNVGQEKATLAGYSYALEHGATTVISLDADLQDDITVMEQMIDQYRTGAEIVFVQRSSREGDSFLKRHISAAYYWTLQKFGIEIVPNCASFYLLGRDALTALLASPENVLVLRNMIASLGFKRAIITAPRHDRIGGETKYTSSKMIGQAIDAITSYSAAPLHIVTFLGFLCVLIALAVFIYAIVGLANGLAVSGWASLLLSVWFVGGLIMISLGIIGEYLIRIYAETKKRPRYIVECTITSEPTEKSAREQK